MIQFHTIYINPDEIKNALRLALGLQETVVRGFVYKDITSICVFYIDCLEIDQAEAQPSSVNKRFWLAAG